MTSIGYQPPEKLVQSLQVRPVHHPQNVIHLLAFVHPLSRFGQQLTFHHT